MTGQRLKQTSNWARTRWPISVELARFRHARRSGFGSELVGDLANTWRDRRILAERRDVCWPADETDEPLVSIRIATRDRPEQLVNRAIPSLFAQTYERIEIVVVGDHCDERTGEAIERLGDPRVRYVNLPRSGVYPSDPTRRWRVAGTKPMNVAVDLVAGTWIAPCDDDDEFTPRHVEDLLTFAKAERLEFVWSSSLQIDNEGNELVIGSQRFGRGCTTHGAVLYSTGLSFIRYSLTSDRLSEPADWNLMKRFRLSGARMGFLDAVTYRYWVAGQGQYLSGSAAS